jgi:hypothetical protein
MSKNILKFGSLSSLFFVAALMVSCQGDDGAPGPAGTNGTNGTNGANGTAGTNGTAGENGVGFEDALKYGKITAELSGKRPDGADFTATIDFPYTPSDLDYTSLYRYEAPTDDYNRVTMKRYQEGTDGSFRNAKESDGSHFYTQAWSWISGFESTYNLEFYQTEFYTAIKFPDEKKFFYLNSYIYNVQKNIDDETGEASYEDGYLMDPVITTFTAAPGNTGKFAFKFSGTIPGGSNSTGYDLQVTFTGDITILEGMNGGEEGRTRGPNTNGRVAETKKVAKAEMQSM